ncbi:MAG: lysophospholipid acyltransferase family protein [Desulfopila sp.]
MKAKASWPHRLALAIVPPLIYWLTRLWFASCRVRVVGGDHLTATLAAGRPTILTFWHYSLLVVFQLMRSYRGVVMVSSSRDGDYVARFAECFGMEAIRGSRNRQGVGALKGLLRYCRQGYNVGIVADGSQGPPRLAQPGGVLLSSRTGNVILPVVWAASRYWTVRSWDKTAFPWPFARVDVIFGQTIEVPPGLAGDGLEEYRLLLEARLNEMYRQAWALHGRTGH